MEKIGRDLQEMQRVPLSESHVEAMRAIGSVVTYPAGTFLIRHGDPYDRFVYVIDGEVEVVNPFTNERRVPATLGPTQFMSEVSFLSGGAASMPMRAARDTQALVVPRAAMLQLMSQVPEMSDIIITVLAARRRRQLESTDNSLALIGEDADRDIRRIAEFAARNRLPYSSYELGTPEAEQLASTCALAPNTPAVVFGRDRVVSEPTPAKIAELLGINLELAHEEAVDVLIVGGGPSGIAAGLYAGAEGLSALVVEDTAIGGQAGTSSRIENYMGFPTGISGADLAWRGEIQAMKFGTRFVMPRRVTGLEKRDDGRFCASLDSGQRVLAKAVVVSTGVQYRRLPIDRLVELEGSGIYYGATESESRYCKGAQAIIIGGGNSAGQAAMFLSRSATNVRVLVRGNSLAASMSQYLSSRLEADPGITIEYGAEVVALHGDAALKAVTIRNVRDGTQREVSTCALFVMVGAAPNTQWLTGQVKLDAHGFILTGDAAGAGSAYETSQPGIFAVGDVRAGSVKRVASSVGEGSVVISKVWDHVQRGR